MGREPTVLKEDVARLGTGCQEVPLTGRTKTGARVQNGRPLLHSADAGHRTRQLDRIEPRLGWGAED
jgi:hypothetical protein